MSRYHRYKQHDGLGYGILRLDADDPSKATVVAVNLDDNGAARRLADLRRTEAKA